MPLLLTRPTTAWLTALLVVGAACLGAAPQTVCGTNSDYDASGFDKYGLDRDGYDRSGYDVDGFDRSGYNRAAVDAWGRDRSGQLSATFDGPDGIPVTTETLQTITSNDLICAVVSVVKRGPLTGAPYQAVLCDFDRVLSGRVGHRRAWVYFSLSGDRTWEGPRGGLRPDRFSPGRRLIVLLRRVRLPPFQVELRDQARRWFPVPYKTTLERGRELRAYDGWPSKQVWSKSGEHAIAQLLARQ